MAMGRVQEAPLALGWAGPSTQSAPPPQPLPRAAASAAAATLSLVEGWGQSLQAGTPQEGLGSARPDGK